MTFLTFPILPASCVIFGKGFQAQQLKKLRWLNTCDIWYWGDIDAHGFEILSQVRGYFPHTRSMLMDVKTYEAFQKYAVRGTDTTQKDLGNLLEEEKSLYKHLFIHPDHNRLEQEHISQEWVKMFLGALGLL